MRSFRLAPLIGGDGTAAMARDAIAISIAQTQVPLLTDIEILNPSKQAFDDWGQLSNDAGVRVIPNSHLRHRHLERSSIGTQSGLNLHDANLLKIKVTHGFKMNIPFVGSAIAKAMLLVDPSNARYYALNQLPISSVATVRMQNEAWESEAFMVAVQTPIGLSTTSSENEFTNDTEALDVTTCADEYGLSGHEALMATANQTAGSFNAAGMCGLNTTFDNDPVIPNSPMTPLEASANEPSNNEECA